jgi:hypothetical protein
MESRRRLNGADRFVGKVETVGTNVGNLILVRTAGVDAKRIHRIPRRRGRHGGDFRRLGYVDDRPGSPYHHE